MNAEIISRILTQYGYADYTLLPLEKGYRNESHPFRLPNDQTLNFILYKQEPGILRLIKNADRSANFASAAGLPARQTVGNKIVKLHTGEWLRYGKIYTYLPGHTIPWEAYTQEHIKLLGKTLSDLHKSLGPLETAEYPLVADQYFTIITRMDKYFSSHGVQEALKNKLEIQIPSSLHSFKRILQGTKHLGHQQVLHMDFVRGNLLFTNSDEIAISGILDFEKTAVGHPLFDIARTLAFLLVDCKYKTDQQIRKYFLRSGYIRRGTQTFYDVTIRDTERSYSLLEVLVTLFLFYDFYKFLRHNPYESLYENEHFIRTKSLLLQDGLIHKA